MKYTDSKIDKKLRGWFVNDNTKALLRGIKLAVGGLRGLNCLDVGFEYPIAAFSGRNGAGKSTVLALACCAYHNRKGGYKLRKRTLPYYTFSDFFIQRREELQPQGVGIVYRIAHDGWKKTEERPDGVGIGSQVRKKNFGGKWNDYDQRVKRSVAFLGIERIVPHSERSQSRSYVRSFRDASIKGWEVSVKEIVGCILNKNYDELKYLEYSKYSLPVVRCGDLVYSGFNMGAGENALFEIFAAIYSCGYGGLIVVDEIELGLHVEAQRKFVEKLKDACLMNSVQVICTTHSKDILDCLPLDARFYIEAVCGKTKVTHGISSSFAFSKMSGLNAREIDILVEDDVAEALLLAALPASIRSRSNIKPIGSASALARQLASAYVRGEDRPILAVFDGDQRSKEKDNIGHAKGMAENPGEDFESWIKGRMTYLPGTEWPESWLVKNCQANVEVLSGMVSYATDDLLQALISGLSQPRHKEILYVAKALGLPKGQCIQLLALCASQHTREEFEPLVALVSGLIDR
ncbi:MAG: AAA family ATPase [Humidesulfovibrio sp.]|uniref:AAA family ATPase n=1 Tax=Humidesulfovibrio sp. TaxID=2910988 RepID=UPI002736A0B5|nr:AAA family ATPase [Humidesulfovibrio sp.]MDP2848217.1 AAA family ATPase [Humidesulfovibrio sp.]